MYSSSTGSIQAALKKLLKDNYIQCDEVVKNGKCKKMYSITEAGREYFARWINQPMTMKNSKNPELTKLYFMGLSQKENRKKLMEEHIENLKESLCILENICEEGEIFSSSIEYNDIVYYQLVTARYGRDYMKFNIEWYQNLLNEIESMQ